MTLVLPTAEQSLTYPAQAVTDATDLGALGSAVQQTGVVSGCTVAALSTPGMAVSVAAGTVLAAGVSVPVAAVSSLTIATAPSTGDRRDIVVSSSAGVVSVVEGTANSATGWTSASTFLPPVKPAVPSGSVLLGEVYVAQGVTSIVSGAVVDKTTPTPAPGPNRYYASAQASSLSLFQGNANSIGGGSDTNGNLFAFPLPCYQGMPPIKSLAMYVNTAGSTGAVYRLGLYADTGGAYPGALIVDAGTVSAAATSGLGQAEVTLATPVGGSGLIWGAVALQGAPSTVPNVQYLNRGHLLPLLGVDTLNDALFGRYTVAYLTTGVTGALPNSYPSGGGLVQAAPSSAAAYPFVVVGF